MNQKRRILAKVVLALFLVACVLCGIGVPSLAITQRCIAVGMSIDWEDGYHVGVQFVQPGKPDTPGAAGKYEVVEGRGPTLTQAMNDVAAKTSQSPSYAHCKVLFVGESLLNTKLDEAMVTLMRSHKLGNVQLVAVEGAGMDTLTATVPIQETSSAYMEKETALVDELGGRTLVSIKDYCQRLDARCGTKYLPYARQVRAEQPLGGDNPPTNPVLFDINNTVAADGDGVMHIYGHEVTQGVGLVEGKSAFLTAYTPDGRYVSVDIRAIRIRRKYEQGTLMGTYRYTVSVVEQTLGENPSAREIESLVDDAIRVKLQDAFDTCKADGVDIFSITGRLYKRYGIDYDLSEVVWQREVQVVCRS